VLEETAGEFSAGKIAVKGASSNAGIRWPDASVKEVMNPEKTGIFAWEVISPLNFLAWLIPLFAAGWPGWQCAAGGPGSAIFSDGHRRLPGAAGWLPCWRARKPQ